jgi:hypothetical protein
LGLAAAFFAEVVVGEGHRQDRIVGPPADAVARRALFLYEYFRHFEPTRPALLESRSHLNAGARMHERDRGP